MLFCMNMMTMNNSPLPIDFLTIVAVQSSQKIFEISRAGEMGQERGQKITDGGGR
jgi:hypothetical protein